MPQLNFFGVGAAKSGTTTLWEWLKQHPDVCVPEHLANKEPAYFCHHYGMKDPQKYYALFSHKPDAAAVGETSNAYLSAPESAGLIHDAYPQSKIFMILRNPIDRAFSLYNWMLSEGYEWVHPFERALEIEGERARSVHFRTENRENYCNFLYFRSGLYADQVKRYQSLFPPSHLRIFLFDDLKHDGATCVRELYKFLTVDETFRPQMSIANTRQLAPRSIKAQYFLRCRFPGIARWSRLPRWKQLQSATLKLNRSLGKTIKFAPATRKRLAEEYAEDISKLENLIGRDLSAWLKDSSDIARQIK